MGLNRLLARFRREEQGAAAIFFALSAAPLAVACGVAVDYARIADYRANMQVGADSAALALAKEPAAATATQLQARAKIFFDSAIKYGGAYATSSLVAARANRVVTVKAVGQVQLAFGGLIGKKTVTIHADSQAKSGKRKIELALALDNTGSMASSNKLVELKVAVNNLLDKMQTLNDVEAGAVKVSLVPFTTQVKVGKSYASAPWLRYNNDGSAPTAAQRSDWLGCVTDRDQPQNISDTEPLGAPLGGPKLQHPAADDPKWNNWPRLMTSAKWNQWAQWCNDLQPVMPLTADLKSKGAGSLRAAISGMKASGNTNVSIGVAWGLKTLMNRAPFSGAAAPGDDDVLKAMIVLTDGDNTEDRWSTTQSLIDARTRDTCATAKDAVKNANGAALSDSYIQIYTIRVIDGNRSLLQDCAANGGSYSEVSAASELNSVFQNILDQITRVRLTS